MPVWNSQGLIHPLLSRVFNTGSPYNIPAGASADLDHLRAHYEKLNVEAEEKRIARLKAHEGDSAMLAQREAEALTERQPEGALEWLGLKKPGVSILESMGLKKPAV